MSDGLLNGFNNGRDTTDGVGGRPGLTERLKSVETKISKTNEEILNNYPYDENGRYAVFMENDVLSAMTAAREDERERMRLMIADEINSLSDKSDSKDRWAISRLNKLLEKMK
jgi:hypothetical protein